MKSLKSTFVLSLLLLLMSGSLATTPVLKVLDGNIDKNIFWLMTTLPKKEAVLERLGPPDLAEDDLVYYALEGFKYSLSLRIANGRVVKMNYKVPLKSRVTIKNFEGIIAAKDFNLYPASGHEAGRYLSTYLKEQKIRLIFTNNSSKQLSRIIYGDY